MNENSHPTAQTSGGMMYDEKDYIQTAKEGSGFGHRGDYKYRVMDKHNIGPTHHTNDFEDAKRWFYRCRDYWIEQDKADTTTEDSEGI